MGILRLGKTVVGHFTDDLYNVLDCVSYIFSGLTIRAWFAYEGDPFRRIFYFEGCRNGRRRSAPHSQLGTETFAATLTWFSSFSCFRTSSARSFGTGPAI